MTVVTPSAGTSYKGDVILPKVSLVYDWTDTFSTGFTWQKGYRPGGSRVSGLGTRSVFEEEFTNNYELSLRSQ